jgi:integrase
MRLSELLGLTWSDIDLDTGTVNLDTNKTDDPRLWALNSSVVVALSRWKKLMSREALKTRRLIVHPKSGRLFNPDGAARRLRKYARLAGLDRSQLYEHSDERIALRVHDMRATFVTISLAQGQSETWVSDRTGHRSSQMLQNYRRVARTYQELNLGPLAPLYECIPELAEMTSG